MMPKRVKTTTRFVLFAGMCVTAVFFHACQGSERTIETALEAISPHLIQSHMRFLSHDLLRGRDTGEEGYELAAEYVVSQFARLGLSPFEGSYLQSFDLLVAREDAGSELHVGPIHLTVPDVNFTPDWGHSQHQIEGEGVYVGYGVVGDGRDDYSGVDVKGKIVFLIPGVPPGWEQDPEKSLLMLLKNEVAIRRGAAAIVTLRFEDDAAAWRQQSGRRPAALADGSTPRWQSHATVGPEACRLLLTEWGLAPEAVKARADEGGDALEVGPVTLVRSHAWDRVRSSNIVGVLPGRDPRLAEEAVLFAAHLDHLGVGEPDDNGDAIYNGAHDNALGVTKVLAAAEALAGLEPRRSVIFFIPGAEEKGLLGSWFYVRNPVLPLERTVAAINQDGGSSGATLDDFMSVGAEYSTLEEIVHEAARQEALAVVDEMLPPMSYSASLLLRSDHFPFFLAGVPAVYLMDGFSVGGDSEKGRQWWESYLENIHHKQADEFHDGWNLEPTVRIARLSARLGWELANRDDVPRFKDDALMKRARGIPAEPFFFRQDRPVLAEPPESP